MSALPRPKRCAVMGVVNVTADSFSDGGHYLVPERAIAHGRQLVADGADIIDVGGESTRPGAHRVDEDTEIARIEPVIIELAGLGITVSVDTMRARVAERALAAGATIVNDVSGGLADPDMASVVADAGCPWVLMHWVSSDGYDAGAGGRAHYPPDIVGQVRDHLSARIDAAVSAGVDPASIVVDPGLGFAKNADDNWAILHELERLVDLDVPVLVAASRKRFLGALLSDGTGQTREVSGRDAATAAISALAAAHGAWGVRVHDVLASADAVRVAAAWRQGSAPRHEHVERVNSWLIG